MKKITYRFQIRAKEDVRKVFDVFEKHPPIIKNKDYKKVLEITQSWLTT